MSLGEEYKTECQAETAYLESCLAENIRKKLWRNAKGTLVPLSHMSASYLKNVLRFVQKPTNDLDAYIPIIEAELRKRAEQENYPTWDNGCFYE